MSPQEDVSGSASSSGAKTPFSPVCSEVRVVMDAVRDNRATPAERVFVATHTEHCPACASEWAFLRATKTAWAQAPMALPSTSLSARIAAATYRKPTLVERLASVFAFLNPVPVRVAIGVAAVAGVSFLLLPRPATVAPDATPEFARDAPRETPSLPESELAATPPVAKPRPRATEKTVLPKPVVTVREKAPVVATKPLLSPRSAPVAVAPPTAPKLAPKIVSPVVKPQPTQVAIARLKPAPRRPTETTVDPSPPEVALPVVRETETRIAAVPTPAPPVAISNPEVKSPAAIPSATVASMTAPENDPGSVGDSTRIKLSNTMRPLSAPMSGKVVRTVSSSEDYSLVSAPTRL